MQSADILDQRDPLGKSFIGSLFFHGGLLALVVASPYLARHIPTLGSPIRNSGTIGVSVVSKIPVPQRAGPINRVANDTQSTVPQKPEPEKPKPAVKEQAPPKDAIAIPTHQKKTRPKRVEQVETSHYKPPEPYKENQVFSQAPQAMKAPELGIQGSGGIGVGPVNPFGEQYGWYAQQIFDRVSQKWQRADVTSRPHAHAVVRFMLLRDGSVQNVQLVQQSGSYTLDSSAQRAVMDAAPLPPFPRGFPYNTVNVDLTFELQQ